MKMTHGALDGGDGDFTTTPSIDNFCVERNANSSLRNALRSNSSTHTSWLIVRRKEHVERLSRAWFRSTDLGSTRSLQKSKTLLDDVLFRDIFPLTTSSRGCLRLTPASATTRVVKSWMPGCNARFLREADLTEPLHLSKCDSVFSFAQSIPGGCCHARD